MRVVSLLPSATEILLAITGDSALSHNANLELVGVSHECDYPPSLRSAPHIPVLTAAKTHFTTSAQIDAAVSAQLSTGESLYTLNAALLADLKPDLIITQDLCEVCSIDLNTVRCIAANLPHPCEILSLNPHTFDAVLDDILRVGDAINLTTRAQSLCVSLRERIARAQEHVNPYADPIETAFLEWTDPLFVAGHWTPQLIERAGGAHSLNPTHALLSAGAAAGPIGQTQRSAGKSIRTTFDDLVASRPQYLIISPCGLSLPQALHETQLLAHHPDWSKLPAVQTNHIFIVDGNHMFSRPGPRLVDAFEFLVGLLNDRPDLIPSDFPFQQWRPNTR